MQPLPDLASLLQPLSLKTFFAESWQQLPLVQHHRDGRRFGQLVSVRDVDFLVSSLSDDGDGLRLVRDGQMLPTTYVQSEEHLIELPKVRNAYQDGYTVILRKLQRRWHPIARLCRQLERDFTAQGVLLSGPVGAHLYSSPRSAKGLPLHYDDHDVITLQIEGAKRWRIFQPLKPFPLEKSSKVSADDCGRCLHDVVLESGDLAYIPRGFCHEASTTSGPSLHLSINVYPYTWLDLLTRLMQHEVRFRQGLPVIPDNECHTITEGLRARLDDLMQGSDISDVLIELRETTAKKLAAFPDAGFEQIDHMDEITLDAVLHKRDGVFSSIAVNPDVVTLMLPGSVLRAPLAMEAVFQFVTDNVKFSVRDLPDALTAEGKIEFAKAMIAEGLLRVALEDERSIDTGGAMKEH